MPTPQKSSAQFSVVILAGGTGTRLWPLSREAKPKQFQPLVGRQTLFQEAVARARLVASPERIFVATNARFTAEVRRQAPRIPRANILSEPAFRDTATCLGYAATVLQSRYPGGVMAVLYADHLITARAEFARKLRAAAEVASSGAIAIIEVKSLFPATELGWVRIGDKIREVQGQAVFAFQRFTEKPNLKKAIEFHRSGQYLWNTGLYVVRTDALLAKYAEHLPDTAARLARISRHLTKPKLVAAEYAACQKISIDYGIMEKVAKSEVLILPADLGWSDVGTWSSLKDELSEATANLVSGQHIEVETTGCFIRTTPGKLVATLGLQDLVIVDTPDALLVCPKSRSGEIKKIVEKLPRKLI